VYSRQRNEPPDRPFPGEVSKALQQMEKIAGRVGGVSLCSSTSPIANPSSIPEAGVKPLPSGCVYSELHPILRADRSDSAPDGVDFCFFPQDGGRSTAGSG
jgi:hypothetical protein